MSITKRHVVNCICRGDVYDSKACHCCFDKLGSDQFYFRDLSAGWYSKLQCECASRAGYPFAIVVIRMSLSTGTLDVCINCQCLRLLILSLGYHIYDFAWQNPPPSPILYELRNTPCDMLLTVRYKRMLAVKEVWRPRNTWTDGIGLLSLKYRISNDLATNVGW